MAAHKTPLRLPAPEFAIHRAELVSYCKSQRPPRNAQIMPVKVVPAFAPCQRAEKLHEGKCTGPGMEQRVLRICPEIAFEPVHVSTQITGVVRGLVGRLRSRLLAPRNLQQAHGKI